MLGPTRMGALAGEVERAASEGALDRAGELVAALERAFGAVVCVLEASISGRRARRALVGVDGGPHRHRQLVESGPLGHEAAAAGVERRLPGGLVVPAGEHDHPQVGRGLA